MSENLAHFVAATEFVAAIRSLPPHKKIAAVSNLLEKLRKDGIEIDQHIRIVVISNE